MDLRSKFKNQLVETSDQLVTVKEAQDQLEDVTEEKKRSVAQIESRTSLLHEQYENQKEVAAGAFPTPF